MSLGSVDLIPTNLLRQMLGHVSGYASVCRRASSNLAAPTAETAALLEGLTADRDALGSLSPLDQVSPEAHGLMSAARHGYAALEETMPALSASMRDAATGHTDSLASPKLKFAIAILHGALLGLLRWVESSSVAPEELTWLEVELSLEQMNFKDEATLCLMEKAIRLGREPADWQVDQD